MTRVRRRRRQLVCQQLVEKVSAYLDGELRPEDRAAVEEHLAGCDDCAGYVQQVRRLLELTAAEPVQTVPADLLEDLGSRFRRRGLGD